MFFSQHFSRLLLTVFLLGGIVSCTSTKEVTAPEQPAEEVSAESTEMTKEELTALYFARRDSARMNFSQADIDFIVGMIGHHAQALIMSDLAPENGYDSRLQVLAARIINAQKDEIALMQRWLKDRNQPVPEVHIDGLNLMIHGAGGHMNMDHSMMPGMLSQDQLNELGEAKGAEFDRLYLTYMIEHHLGAVTMVEKLFATDGAAQDTAIFELASDVQVDQKTEIARMRLLLNQLTENAE